MVLMNKISKCCYNMERLTEGNGGANTGKNEEEGGDELGQVGLERGWAKRVADASECYLHHCCKIFAVGRDENESRKKMGY